MTLYTAMSPLEIGGPRLSKEKRQEPEGPLHAREHQVPIPASRRFLYSNR